MGLSDQDSDLAIWLGNVLWQVHPVAAPLEWIRGQSNTTAGFSGEQGRKSDIQTGFIGFCYGLHKTGVAIIRNRVSGRRI